MKAPYRTTDSDKQLADHVHRELVAPTHMITKREDILKSKGERVAGMFWLECKQEGGALSVELKKNTVNKMLTILNNVRDKIVLPTGTRLVPTMCFFLCFHLGSPLI